LCFCAAFSVITLAGSAGQPVARSVCLLCLLRGLSFLSLRALRPLRSNVRGLDGNVTV